MWQMAKENLKTGEMELCGTYSSLKQGLQYAPEVLDVNFDEIKVDTDTKDEKIGDLMQCGGKLAVVVKGYQFFLSKKMFDVYGETVASPSGSIRIGGKAKWKNPKGGVVYEVMVKDIVSPSLVKMETEDGMFIEVPFSELKAA